MSRTISNLLIGMSLSEPHTSVTALRSVCVCLLGSCTYRKFKISGLHLHMHNNIQIPTAIPRGKVNRAIYMYLFDRGWRQQRRRPLVNQPIPIAPVCARNWIPAIYRHSYAIGLWISDLRVTGSRVKHN